MLQRCVEAEALQKHTATLNEVVVNPNQFGALLEENGFATKMTISSRVNTLGYTDYQKVSQLLHIIDSRIRTSTRESAREFFNKLVLIFSNRLGRTDIAEGLVATCSKCTQLTTAARRGGYRILKVGCVL